MKNILLIVIGSLLALNANAATPKKPAEPPSNQSTNAAPKSTEPEAPILRKDNYRLPMEQVIVIGQDPYWKKEGKPRWDRSKVEVDTKPTTDSRLKVFPTYTTEERDEAMKIRDRNNATPKIKLFDIKF